jgi:hypothetical protein
MSCNRPSDQAELDAQVDRLIEALRRRTRRRTHQQPRPVPALALARWLGVRVGSSAESRKRGVRRIIDQARASGAGIVADFRGYWLAETAADHADYQQFRARMGLSHLAAASKDRRSVSASDCVGQQGWLF